MNQWLHKHTDFLIALGLSAYHFLDISLPNRRHLNKTGNYKAEVMSQTTSLFQSLEYYTVCNRTNIPFVDVNVHAKGVTF
ncbi:hypothetical protein FKM82_006010 [Ascaphus truei]